MMKHVQVLGCIWDKHGVGDEERFLTYGIHHIKMWTLSLDSHRSLFRPRLCSWHGEDPLNVLCAAFLPCSLYGWAVAPSKQRETQSVFVTGHEHGELLFWMNTCCVRKINCSEHAYNTFSDTRQIHCIKVVPIPEESGEDCSTTEWVMATGGGCGAIHFWGKHPARQKVSFRAESEQYSLQCTNRYSCMRTQPLT